MGTEDLSRVRLKSVHFERGHGALLVLTVGCWMSHLALLLSMSPTPSLLLWFPNENPWEACSIRSHSSRPVPTDAESVGVGWTLMLTFQQAPGETGVPCACPGDHTSLHREFIVRPRCRCLSSTPGWHPVTFNSLPCSRGEVLGFISRHWV